MLLVSLALGLSAAILLLPSVSDLVSLARAAGRRRAARRTPRSGADDHPPRLLFLVPAHDEELLLPDTLRSLDGLSYPAERRQVVVVADNCRDATARLAREAGVTVLEREDTVRRGKPWALAWALERLPVASFDAVVVMDADATVDRGFARGLAARAPLAEKVVQPYNDVANPGDNALTRMASVFSAARCRFMNELKGRAGLNVPLGNGLCIGSGVLRRHGWQAFSICEDWELYALLTRDGVPIEGTCAARAFAQETRSLSQSASQRRRWTAGKIAVLRRHGPSILRSPLASARQKLDALAELSAPGPAVHFGVAALAAGGALALDVPGDSWLALALALSVARLFVYAVLGISVEPHPARAIRSFVFFPFYTIWRLGIQLGALPLVGAQAWVRTARHRGSHAGAA